MKIENIYLRYCEDYHYTGIKNHDDHCEKTSPHKRVNVMSHRPQKCPHNCGFTIIKKIPDNRSRL